MVSSLIRELEASGKLDNTFIFFSSDNGFQQGEHRIPKGKNVPYEESVRVPLFVRGPGVPAGAKIEDPVINTDFAPTFADLGGESFSGDGRSLKPLSQGQDPPWRSAVLLERPSNNKQAFSAIRTNNYKYVEYDNGEKELYDLQADPSELNSIPESANPSLYADLKAKLDALKSCSGEGCREAENFSQSPSALPLPSSGGPPQAAAPSSSSVGDVNKANGAATLPYQGEAYTVQYGDTLSEIAQRSGSTVVAIAEANGIQDPNVIFAQQRLYIPVSSVS
jgi:LysM repeat protein